jgi:hypothetical protein
MEANEKRIKNRINNVILFTYLLTLIVIAVRNRSMPCSCEVEVIPVEKRLTETRVSNI